LDAQVRPDLSGFESLLQAASPAILVVTRADGTPVVSPVWFRFTGDAFEVVIAEKDPKLGHIGRNPNAVLTIFEPTPPFRGVEVRGPISLRTEGVGEARRAISSRYLGPASGARFTAKRGDRGFVASLPLSAARTWDLRAILPEPE